jgi:15,16-dihydrobiliverdin:ferredoxin oxidoreductase
MDELAAQTKELLEEKLSLEPLALPPELSHIKLPLKLLDLHCYNWRAEKVRKIYFMRIKVTVPSLDIFGMALYPANNLDIPSFVYDFSCTKKKVFSYINFVPLFDDPSYLEKYIEPMKKVHESHVKFPRQNIREWMQPYVAPFAVYSLPLKAELPELKRCALDYLRLYLDLFSQAVEIKDPAYLEKIENARKTYLKDLATYDNSRKMLGKIIGKERANRIFQEAVT